MINRDMDIREKSIVLIGFMGVGKTTVGQLLAQKLNRSLVDIDQVIESDFGMPTTEIFNKYGESTFRKYEKETVISYCKLKCKIISVGGGAFLNEEVRKACLSNCLVVYLDIPWEEWKKRLHMLIDSRPVLQGRTLDEIRKLFDERQKIYAAHHLKVTIDAKSAAEVADDIVDCLQSAWKIHP